MIDIDTGIFSYKKYLFLLLLLPTILQLHGSTPWIRQWQHNLSLLHGFEIVSDREVAACCTSHPLKICVLQRMKIYIKKSNNCFI